MWKSIFLEQDAIRSLSEAMIRGITPLLYTGCSGAFWALRRRQTKSQWWKWEPEIKLEQCVSVHLEQWEFIYLFLFPITGKNTAQGTDLQKKRKKKSKNKQKKSWSLPGRYHYLWRLQLIGAYHPCRWANPIAVSSSAQKSNRSTMQDASLHLQGVLQITARSVLLGSIIIFSIKVQSPLCSQCRLAFSQAQVSRFNTGWWDLRAVVDNKSWLGALQNPPMALGSTQILTVAERCSHMARHLAFPFTQHYSCHIKYHV